MFQFSNKYIFKASINDLLVIEALLNVAYRGPQSTKGWTTEAHLIAGSIRTNEADMLQTFNKLNSVFLVYRNEQNTIEGCVNLQLIEGKLYLGMFAVNPLLQGGGIGRQLLNAAEEYAHHIGVTCIYMSVISVRTELIDWYKRNGYIENGHIVPFEENDHSGKHLQPLFFLYLEKKLQ
jgi:ribosomal protein S18 acetylase RimI-like enzyme